MKEKPPKNHQKIVAPRKAADTRALVERLMAYRASLRHTSTSAMPKQVTCLMRGILTATARGLPGLSERETLKAVIGAALLTALAFNQDRSDFSAWLRRTADSLDAARPK